MKRIVFLLVVASSLLGGCATTGGAGQSQQAAEKPSVWESITQGASQVASGVGSGLKAATGAVTSLYGPYTNGVKITQAQLAQIVPGTTTEDELFAVVGHPMRTEAGRNGTAKLYYDYTEIKHIGANINVSNVFVVSRDGVVDKHYQTGRASKTGNPLVDAANGVQ